MFQKQNNEKNGKRGRRGGIRIALPELDKQETVTPDKRKSLVRSTL